ncbi:MAG: Na(+)-translocating NADH-quinone reductase subunit A [Hyphomicrobiales bacterium]
MSKVIHIKKGLDIKLLGTAKKTVLDLSSEYFAIKPIDFIGLFPKVLVKEGDRVQAGTPLFFDKYRDYIKITSPIGGVIHEIRRGPKRVLLEIVIKEDEKEGYVDFGAADPKSLKPAQIIEKLLASGAWAMLRQRPYSIVANPTSQPKAIVISGFDSSPLAPDFNFILKGKDQAFQTGINALKKLSEKVYLNLNPDLENDSILGKTQEVETYYFKGPHPAGNVGIQVNKIDPINKGETIWYLDPQQVVTIGELFMTGQYDPKRTIALTGSEVKEPMYYTTKLGASIKSMIENNVSDIKKRYISGNVLTGQKIERDGFVSFHHNQVTVIPEGDYHEFLGWALPGIKKYSFSKTFFSYLFKKREYRLDTNVHGGPRAFVMTGHYEKVLPLDIYPMQLLKAIMVQDIEQMENLGIYEVDEEDFALCEFIDTSKTEIQTIIRDGLDLMRKEMS